MELGRITSFVSNYFRLRDDKAAKILEAACRAWSVRVENGPHGMRLHGTSIDRGSGFRWVKLYNAMFPDGDTLLADGEFVIFRGHDHVIDGDEFCYYARAWSWTGSEARDAFLFDKGVDAFRSALRGSYDFAARLCLTFGEAFTNAVAEELAPAEERMLRSEIARLGSLNETESQQIRSLGNTAANLLLEEVRRFPRPA